MTKITLACGPPHSGQRQRLIERCREVARSNAVGAGLWLAPNYRASAAIRPLLHEGFDPPHAPLLLTLQDFADAIVHANDPAARPISHLQRRLLLEKIISRLHEEGELSHFRRVIDTHGFAQTVFAFVAELKQNEIRPEQLEEALTRAGVPAALKEQQCARIYQEYQAQLNHHHLYDLEGRLWHARDLLNRQLHQPFEHVRAVFVHGFTNFSRAQHDILEALGQWVEELWITLHDDPDDPRAELFDPVRQTAFRFSTLFPTIVSEPFQPVTSPRPAGLLHLQNELFRPRKEVRRSAGADGVALIAAPGLMGEARLVARQIKHLLNQGIAADDILVVVRDAQPYADLLHEVFTDYAIPVDVEGTEPLLRNAAVAALLRARRIPDEDYPFVAVTALLRSTFFQPDWPDVSAPEVAQRSEALLRLLGEPRGREAYLRAVRRWAENPLPGLEDEQAEESRRQRIHELARECRPFLERFLHGWDGAPGRAPLPEHVAWLHRLAENLGITRTAALDSRDQAALTRFLEELDRWLALEQLLHGEQAPPTLDRAQFDRLLHVLALQAGLARTPRGPGRVRILSALLARGLETPYVFLLGLSERNFPQLVPPESLLDEQERQGFKQAGLDFPSLSDLLPREMLLFYQITTSATHRLTLSYPAVDERGQDLLPSSFLATLLDCFEPGAVPTERRNMLIEGYASDRPLSPAEYRVQAACLLAANQSCPLPQPLADQLQAARTMAWNRFHNNDHTVYDGLFQDRHIIAEVAGIFGPEKILSPTTLESYIACPFKFFLTHVLRLEPLDEPSEEIESTDRGLVVHRALSRLHKDLQARGVHQPADGVDADLVRQLEVAVGESATRASAAGEVLWRLEGERLKRLAQRYRAHWQKFVAPWLTRELQPQPAFFEVGFGLPPAEGEIMSAPLVIRFEEIEVRVSGRIDRVDTVLLPDGNTGFWIIDYKTGRPDHYTGSGLKEFRKLQLTLYALAVEEVLLTGRNARPLGLAYWLVADSGPKVALPGHPRYLAWLDEARTWPQIRRHLQRWVVDLVMRIRQGQFALKPRSELCTATCDFGQICRISQSRAIVARKKWQLELPVVSE
jgi:ATP-dependent helicase/nuclease subunit B